MNRRQSIWNILNAVLGGLAAIITAGTGLYLALKTTSTPSPSVSASVASLAPAAISFDSASGTTYDRTPWLGVELRQDNQPIRMRSTNDTWDKFEATLARGPFEITITRHADDPNIGILAWQDDSIFDAFQDNKFKLRGTGIAGAQFAVPILYLDKEGFNYYDTERMKRLDADKYSIFISTIGAGDLELPLPRFAGPIYLAIFRAPKEIGADVPRQDFELFTLRRP
ncbi:MAG TPA: hypothetical protein VGM76_03530 [Lacipirellulaceae bacterium]|jgi:hypothetical protein